MKVNVEEVSPIEKKLSVEVDADRVTKALDRAYQALAREVKVPGFRQGKVPRRILEARFRDRVEQDVVQRLVTETYGEVVGSEKLTPVDNPVVTPEPLVAGKEFRYEARVEVKPVVVAKDYKGLTYEKVEPEVTDAKIDEELERLRQQAAQFVPIEERTAAITGDYAMIDYEGFLDDEPIPGAKGEGVTVKVEEGSLLEGNAPMLAGVTVGETIDAEVPFPEDFREESLQGKVGRFRVTLHGLRKREVPELDDEFAKDLERDVETLEALREQIRESMEAAEKERAERENRSRLLQALIDKNPFEVPKAMVERTIDVMLGGLIERLAQQGLDVRSMGLDFGAMREDARAEATQRVRTGLLLEAIANQEGIEVGEEDLEAHFQKIADDLKMPIAKVRAHFERDPEAKKSLSDSLREEKALALISAEAKVSG